MTIGQTFQSVIRNYANFSGRSPRSEYWWWQLIIAIPIIIAIEIGDSAMSIVLAICVLPTISLAWRRAHDCGLPGFLMLIPLVREAIALLPSNEGINKFGPPAPPQVGF